MKIAIVTNFLYPEGLGGTELYCYQLAEALQKQGNDVFWFVPNFNTDSTIIESYNNGVSIVRFAAIATGKKPDADFVAQSFIKEMNARDLTIAHFNEFGGFEGISNSLLNKAREAGIKSIVTLHLLHYICKTGTLRYGGVAPCNGQVIPSCCGSCGIFSEATPVSAFNYFLTRFFSKAFYYVEKKHVPLFPKFRKVMDRFKDKLPLIESLAENADVIVTLTKWFKEILIINGIPDNKIVLIPQASPFEEVMNYGSPEIIENKFVFIGRINKGKGIDLLLKAADKLRKTNPQISIDLYGPVPLADKHANHFLNKIKIFSNINYKGILKPEDVMPTMAKYKAVLLPSFYSEMAPLIIMEATKMKVPVIVSDVPGSSELTNQYDAGFIFKYGSSDDLVNKILLILKGAHQFAYKQPFENNFYHVAKKYIDIFTGKVTMGTDIIKSQLTQE